MESKERGSNFVSASPSRAVTNYEYRWQYAPTGWYKEYRETQSSFSHSFYRTDHEAIQYDMGKTRFNTCIHSRSEQPDPTRVSEFEFKATPGMSTTWAKYGEKRSAIAVPYDLGSWTNGSPTSAIPAMPSYDWTPLVGDVGSQVSGKLAASNNMLVELAQIGQTIGMLKHPFAYRDIYKFRKQLLSLGKLSKTAANAYLEYKYGWKNLWLAVKSLAAAYGSAQAHYVYLQMSAGRFTHISKSNSADQAWTGYLPYTIGNYAIDHSCCALRTKAHHKYSFGFDVIRPASAMHYSIMDLCVQNLGMDDVAAALWDLTPFSFVADWFIGLDKWLQRDPIFLSSFNIRKVGYSIKSDYYAKPVIRQRIVTPSGSSTYPYTEWTGDEKRIYKKYVRYPGFPPSTSSSNWTGLSTSQLLDGAALIIQRL